MRLLIVEDEHRMAAAMQRGLVHAGFTVDVASDGVHGLELASTVTYDAIVLDVMLPGLSGYEVTRRLRAQRIWTPILLATAKDGDYDQADGLDLGADDYLIKPFSFVVLLARIRALLRRGAPPRPSVLVVGPPHARAPPKPGRQDPGGATDQLRHFVAECWLGEELAARVLGT